MKKKILLLVLCALMFTLTGCLIQDHIMIPVGEGLKVITEQESYCVETEIYLNNPEETRDENALPDGYYIVTVDGDKTKHELNFGSFSYTYYTYVDRYGFETMIFNANPFDAAQGTLWLSTETGYSVEDEGKFDFLLEIEDEYFDLEDDVYTLNEKGEANIKEWLESLIGENPYINLNFNEQSTTKIYVDYQRVHEIKTNMVLLDFVDQEKIYQADLEISFTRLNEAIVNLPVDVMSVEEYTMFIQESFEMGITEMREAIVEAVQALGEDFFDSLLNMEEEAMQQLIDILHDVMGDYDAFVEVIEEYLGELAKYVEIDGIAMELLEEVLKEFEGELDDIETVLNKLQEKLEEEVDLLIKLFKEFVEEYEEEIVNELIEELLKRLGL